MRVSEAQAAPIDILIAEDEVTHREALRCLLEGEGYRCAAAGNGLEAVELAWRHVPRCVLLDLRIPELDGFSVARRLRADPRTRGARIHCLTGLTDPDARAAALNAGCELFLTKPVEAAALLQLLGQQLGPATEWARGLTKTEAEDLLDWLEAHGAAGEVAYEGPRGFAVRCPGFHVGKDAKGGVVLSRP
jgi:CheY-like chemotaxis protein